MTQIRLSRRLLLQQAKAGSVAAPRSGLTGAVGVAAAHPAHELADALVHGRNLLAHRIPLALAALAEDVHALRDLPAPKQQGVCVALVERSHHGPWLMTQPRGGRRYRLRARRVLPTPRAARGRGLGVVGFCGKPREMSAYHNEEGMMRASVCCHAPLRSECDAQRPSSSPRPERHRHKPHKAEARARARRPLVSVASRNDQRGVRAIAPHAVAVLLTRRRDGHRPQAHRSRGGASRLSG